MAAKQRLGVAGSVHFLATLTAEFGFTSKQKWRLPIIKNHFFFLALCPRVGHGF